MTTESTHDLVVVGGGNAFRVAHQFAAKGGGSVALIERGPLGGTCPNRGCIPSKRLYVHALAANRVRRAQRFGIDAPIRGIDADGILRDVRESIEGVDEEMEERLHDDVELIRGEAHFVDERELEIDDGRRVSGRRVVIATGSRPRRPDPAVIGDVPYMTSEDVFALEHAPRSLVIVGAGPVGTEMTTFFDAFGTEVRLLQRGDTILPREDEEARTVVQRALANRVQVETGARWTSTEVIENGIRLHYETRAGKRSVEAEALLVAIGRVPNTDELGLGNTSVETDDRGRIRVDARLATTAEGVFALGDVRVGPSYTHTASAEAHYLAQHLLGEEQGELELDAVPHATFSDPPIAAVGMTEEQFREAVPDGIVARKAYRDVAMGAAMKEEHGFCKLLVDRSRRIRGAHIVGEEAPTLLHEVMLAMRCCNDVDSIASMMHVHPALPELVQATARAAASELRA